jgi:hypothetical protein
VGDKNDTDHGKFLVRTAAHGTAVIFMIQSPSARAFPRNAGTVLHCGKRR